MIFSNFFNNKNINRYNKLIKKIDKLSDNYTNLAENEFAGKLLEIKNSSKIKNEDKILHAMAIAKLSATKTLNMTYYNVQLLGALALTDGCMAEMKTGEGKTLTCSAAVAANYVLGLKTHVATANDYLAERDSNTLKKLYDNLGITSGFVTSKNSKDEKRDSYKKDVIYSTAQELGFDFLRDNLVLDINEKIQPNLKNVKAIIDEADFILIDEARTPLIISGESPFKSPDAYRTIRDLSTKLTKMKDSPKENYLQKDEYIPGDFWIEEKHKTVHLSEEGFEKIENLLGEYGFIETNGKALYNHNNTWLIHEILNALKAEYVFIKDKDYIVHNGEIVIIDQNTGRLSEGRTWSNGLHQAIETKENVQINPETMTLGTISIQNYFRNYKNIAGMSGTIMGSTTEFHEIYNTTTIKIPTNKKMVRKDHTDKVYITKNGKYQDLVKNVKERHDRGQPILIGTTSVAESEEVSNLLNNSNIKHNVLNAKNNFKEAQIIAQAGRPYSVTVSTSMAGRGTDIILGGNKEELLKILRGHKEATEERISFFKDIKKQIEEQGIEMTEPELIVTKKDISIETIQERLGYLYQQENMVEILNNGIENVLNYLFMIYEVVDEEEILISTKQQEWREKVIKEGGLFVLGSSRNESRRIDDQLRGRAGRQGDQGESLFYVSFEDSWVSMLGQNPVFQHLAKTIPENEAIESPMISKALAKAQNGIEGLHYSSRKSTFQYDSMADEGRRQYLAFRDLAIKDYDALVNFTKNAIIDNLTVLANEDFYNWYLDNNNINEINHIELVESLLKNNLKTNLLTIKTFEDAGILYNHKDVKKEVINRIEDWTEMLFKNISQESIENFNFKGLKKLDSKWSEHLVEIEDARQNVAFHGMAQKNPLHEFKKICFDTFNQLFEEFGLDCIEILEDHVLIQNEQTETTNSYEVEVDILKETKEELII